MKDKEKQIEEMAKEFCPIYIDPTYEDCELCKQGSNGNCDALKKLKKVIKKLFPKDSVVLSREEYEALKKQIEYWEYETKVARQDLFEERKETAEKILKWLKEHYDGVGWVLVETYFKEQFNVKIKD